jgi:hypothetical protein
VIFYTVPKINHWVKSIALIVLILATLSLIFARCIDGADSEYSLAFSVSVGFRLFTDRFFPFLFLGKKCNLDSTNLKRIDTVIHNKLPENLGRKEGKFFKNRKGKNWSVKRHDHSFSGTRQ